MTLTRRTVSTLVMVLLAALAISCGKEKAERNQTQVAATESSVDAPIVNAHTPSSGNGLVGTKLEPIHVFDLSGKGSEIGGPREKVSLVNLWATWCGPCRYEIPALIGIHEKYASRGFEVVGVSVDAAGSEDSVREFTKQTGINYPIVLDPDGVSASMVRSSVLPTSVLLDRDGRILWTAIGVIREGDPELTAAIEKALE